MLRWLGITLGLMLLAAATAGVARLLLRVNEAIYALQLSKIENDLLHAKLSEQIAEKYSVGGGSPESVWIFRLDPRT